MGIRITREPLLHFLLIGAAIFGLSYWVDGDRPPGGAIQQEVVVTSGHVETITNRFAKVWQRPPSEAELDGLIKGYIKEEILYREALALGLDQDDAIVRRRMKQKIEFLTQGITKPPPPTDQELLAFMQSHQEAFMIEPQVNFRQVFLNPERHGAALDQEIARLLNTLPEDSQVDVAELGDSLMLPHALKQSPQWEIDRQFGQRFSAGLFESPVGRWHGPVVSGFGVHLVYVNELIEGRLPALQEVRDKVVMEWQTVKQREADAAVYEALRDRYTVTIAYPVKVGEPGQSPGGAGA
jgi:hypothetical protein